MRPSLKLYSLFGCLFLAIFSVNAQVVTPMVYFYVDSTNGDQPWASLTLGTDGNFYGVTDLGGNTNVNSGGGAGTVFRLTTNGVLTTLATFSRTNGNTAIAGLALGKDGNLYGVTLAGGNTNPVTRGADGTIFKVTTNGILTLLTFFSSTNGANPQCQLAPDSDGNLYGTTLYGGYTNLNGGEGLGTVFKVTTNGDLTSLVSFAGTNGAEPWAGLTLGGDGNFYGTTSTGANALGTIFKVATNGIWTTLYSFSAGASYNGIYTNSDGAGPRARLTVGSDGNLYGTTFSGGLFGYGTIFRVTTNGELTLLASFANTNGANSEAPLILGRDGNFYGTTSEGGNLSLDNGSGAGTIFRVTTNGVLTSLFSFSNTNGESPRAALTLGPDGNFYGTTFAGGNTNGYGTVFVLSFVPVPLSVQGIDNAMVLSWTGPAFTLQCAPNADGIYTNVPGATSPYTNSVGGTQGFFRLQYQ